MLSSATGTFHWEWSKGGLLVQGPSSGKPEAASFNLSDFDSWTAGGLIANGSLNLQESHVVNGNDATPVGGTISFARELNLSSGDKTDPVKITGTLQRPLILTEAITAAK